jgi:hypothetical protein
MIIVEHLTTTNGPYFDSSHKLIQQVFKVKVFASAIAHTWALGII